MRWKLLLRKLSISSPEVSVRSHLPVPVRRLLLFFVLAFAAAAGVGIYEYGRGFGGPDRRELSAQVERLETRLREAEAERSRLTATVTALEAQMKVERAAQDQFVISRTLATPEGKAAYVAEQRRVADRGDALRARLVAACDALLGAGVAA